MRLSEIGCRLPPRAAAVLLLCALVAVPAVSAELTLRKLRIETDPPGAEVLLIGGQAGYTPLTISERAIYPNVYRDDQTDLYGTVTLRRAGCDTVVHRVTLEDIERGLNITLDCDASPAERTAPVSKPEHPVSITRVAAPLPPPAASDPVVAEAVSQRRLRQLQVLQELLDEGLISAAEEQRIRRRLLEAP
jgi:hypothetical protein